MVPVLRVASVLIVIVPSSSAGAWVTVVWVDWATGEESAPLLGSVN
jgi:hypothetical protein